MRQHYRKVEIPDGEKAIVIVVMKGTCQWGRYIHK
nr:MAG TPA: hypothetical protein [Caudoviricetes sp.]